jgi:hypothetical protein
VEESTSDGSSSDSAAASGGILPAAAATVVRNPTVLYIDHHSYFDDEEQLVHLAWGGGARMLLSAASRRCILVFSLLPYFSKLLRGDPARHLLQPVLPSVDYAFVDLHRLSGDLLAADWTHDGQGLLYSDQNGMVSMLTVASPAGLWRPEQQGEDAPQLPPPSPGEQEAELQQLSVQELWKAHAEGRHDVVAAGPSPLSPSASASLENAQRLLVWWPLLHPRTGKVTIGAEVIRHPVRLQHMEWGPALEPAAPPVVPPAAAGSPTRPESSFKAFARSLSPAKQQRGSPAASAPASPAAAGGEGEGAAPEAPPAPQHPALMTLGADWVIRIWVEVVMANMSAASASQPSQPMSQFCLSLVIEPPSLAISHAIRPGMAASWARHLNGTPRANGVHSNVLWLMANVSMYVQPAEGALDSEPGFRDILYLWAVDGLHSVVLSGIATNALMYGSQASPRAILWGQDSTTLGWHQPRRLLSRTAQRSLAVAVFYKSDVPMLVVGQQFCDPASCYSELRAFKLFPVSLERGTGTRRGAGQRRWAGLCWAAQAACMARLPRPRSAPPRQQQRLCQRVPAPRRPAP